MKLQLGLLHLNGRPASREDRADILGDFTDRSVDIAGEVVDGSLLMIYRGNRITLEEESETQPYRLGPHVLTWDGRLDNREDLADRLGLRCLEGVPDPVIVLKAFQVFGESVLPDLIGEFALALWCHTDKSVLFARSTCGARPLYYVLNHHRLLWCSDFAHLVRRSGADLAVNDEYVVQYLVTTPDVKQTPLANVKAIAPNRIVHFKDGKMTTGCELWNPIHTSSLPCRTDGEYEELCREKIAEAVRVRLRSRRPVFAELSGGLDSSSIVLTADRILRSQNTSPHNLHTVSCVYEESISADETRFIAAVEDRRDIKTHLIHEHEQRITLGLEDPPFTGLPHTLHCFPGRYERIAALMAEHNAQILLTGRGGDHLFWSEPDGASLVADELRKAHLFNAHRECKIWSRTAAIPYYTLLATKALPLAVGSLFPGIDAYKKPELPNWVHPRHLRVMQETNTDFEGYARWRGKPSRRAHVFLIDRMLRMLGSGFGQEYDGIYVSHPYSHRPLVEFCLRTPISQFLRMGQFRSLMRRAMADVLPSKTVRRVSKGLVDETIVRALQREWASIWDLMNWQVGQRGYVNYPRLSEALDEARLGIVDLLGPLIKLFSLERWLRSLSQVQRSRHSSPNICNLATIGQFSH